MLMAHSSFSLFGIDLSFLSENLRLAILVVGHVSCAITFALLQERVFLIPDFNYAGFMTLLTTSTYVVCGYTEMALSNDIKRRAEVHDYAILSFLTYFGSYLTNWSLQYLSYPSRVMFKSSKVIPVMLIGVVYLRRQYSRAQYLNVLLLVSGIVLFTSGDMGSAKPGGPSTNSFGLLLISGGVVADALTANFEEKRFFGENNCSHAEIMCFSNVIATLISCLMLVSTGELWPALSFATRHPQMVSLTVAFSFINYFSVSFILLMISQFGSTNSEIVKAIRKVASIALSFLVYSKPITRNHYLGGALFFSSVAMGVYLKMSKKSPKKNVKDHSSDEERVSLVGTNNIHKRASNSPHSD
eukprot:148305_1